MVTKEEKEYILKAISMLLRREAAIVVSYMLEKEAVSEEWLAKQSDLKITVVRKILYDLFNLGLVDFIKERDEKSGWYIYNATFKLNKLNEVILDRLKNTLKKLKQRLKYEEENTFYECPVHKIRMLESEAITNNYICNIEGCNSVLEIKDNTHIINKLKKKIQEIENIIREAEKGPVV